MAERYTPLPGDAVVLRLAERGKDYFPLGVEKPLPKWLEPSTTDKQDAARTGRPAGLSVWNAALAAPAAACWFGARDPAAHESFAAVVAAILAAGAANDRHLTVVTDPLPPPSDDPRWPAVEAALRPSLLDAASGHALVEGIARPDGAPRLAHRALLDALVVAFARHVG